jgi:tetratricopeptide (TPR) repeat protein
LDPTYLDNLGQILLLTRAGRRYSEARDAVRRYEAAQRAQAVPNDPDQLSPEERTQWLLAKFSTLERGETKEMDEFLVRVASERPTFAGLHPLRVDEAMQRGDATKVGRLYALRPDTSPSGVLGAAMALAAGGDLEAARAKLTELPQKLRDRLVSEPANDQLWGQLARVEALLGNKDEALRCVQEAEALVPYTADAWAGTRAEMSAAFVYAWTGEKARAVDAYARLLSRPSELSGQTNNTLNVHVMRRGVWYAPLRGDPRFEALLNDPKNNAPLF